MPPSTVNDRVARNVRAEIARNGYSQTSFAAKLGRTQTSFSRRMTGEVPFTVDELNEIAQALGVTMSALIEDASEAASA